MNNKVSGRCLCGSVVYEYTGSVGPANYCYCEDCRRVTGSAFNIGVRFHLAELRITRGRLKGYTKRGESGNELTRHFCPECGSPIYTSSPKHPEYVYVKAGTLDDPGVVKPTHRNWLVSEVSWSHPPRGIRSFQRGTE